VVVGVVVGVVVVVEVEAVAHRHPAPTRKPWLGTPR